MLKNQKNDISKDFKIKECLKKIKVENGKLLNREEVVKFAQEKFNRSLKTADSYVTEAFRNYLFDKKEKKFNDRAIRDSLYNKDQSYPLPDYIILGTDEDETIKDHYVKMLIEKTKNHKNYGNK